MSGEAIERVSCECCERTTAEPLFHSEEGDSYCGRCVAELLSAEIKQLREQRDAAREAIERAYGALITPGATNYEKVQAAGLILAMAGSGNP